jgi:Ca-activated chloride channel family protein
MPLQHWFAYPLALVLLSGLIVLAGLALWARRRRRLALARVGSPMLLALLTPAPARGRWRRGFSLTLGLMLLALGSAGPQWGRDWDAAVAPGRDLVVVLDCSRSMLAETPSRLERARRALLDLAQELQKHGGQRVALVTFAGLPRLVCPLTPDMDHFREAVNRSEPAGLDPALTPERGGTSGTRIGLGLMLAVQAHDPRFRGARDVLLLSDGDDPVRDGEWARGARVAAAQDIRVYTVGLGNPDSSQASTIPTAGGPLLQDGKEVRTSLDEAPLIEIAQLTGGSYIPAHTRSLPLGRVYLDAVAGQPLREAEDDNLPVYRPRYAWFLLPAFTLLVMALSAGDGSKKGAVP